MWLAGYAIFEMDSLSKPICKLFEHINLAFIGMYTPNTPYSNTSFPLINQSDSDADIIDDEL